MPELKVKKVKGGYFAFTKKEVNGKVKSDITKEYVHKAYLDVPLYVKLQNKMILYSIIYF